MSDRIDEQATAGAEDYGLDPRSVEEAATSSPDAGPVDMVGDLKQQLAEAREEAAAQQHKFLRARADMENFKKRIERTYADEAHSAKKQLLNKMLVVKDNLERALHYGTGGEASGESLLEGVRLTQYQLDQLLQQEGVQAIEAEGQAFDPRLEEAVHSVDDRSVPDHTVVQVARAGYTFGDEVLRPAQVVVSVHGEQS